MLSLWDGDTKFVEFYISIFRQCGFKSYVWETPPLSTRSLDQPFEFVIINNPVSKSKPDITTYKKYFDFGGPNCGVVAFKNLGHDAMLVVPSPSDDTVNYSGLSDFYSEAPIDQQYSLWKVLAKEIYLILSEKNIWVSVAGGGISWLHVRIDRSPKYYRHFPYRVKS